ncbi:MAG: hypothetical protein HOE90_12795 [Bacteriovoracaceae bacterium]|jgi:hypothetical protein|nr:hypothetical protein [Bacteriovoracaceae bacterium]
MSFYHSVWFKRIEKLIIVLLHLLHLRWLLFILQEGGTLQTQSLLLHFVGVGVTGGLLIAGTSTIVKNRHIKEQGLSGS